MVEPLEGGDHYVYAYRDGVELHLARVESIDLATTTCCVYLWVDEADELYREWAAAGVQGQLDQPVGTSCGLRAGAHVDVDGNLIRFGSPPLAPRALRERSASD